MEVKDTVTEDLFRSEIVPVIVTFPSQKMTTMGHHMDFKPGFQYPSPLEKANVRNYIDIFC